MIATSTYFALLAGFGSAEIPLAQACDKFFGLDEREAKCRAAVRRLPVPAHRLGGQKSGWLINAADLASHIDHCREAATRDWQNSRAAQGPRPASPRALFPLQRQPLRPQLRVPLQLRPRPMQGELRHLVNLLARLEQPAGRLMAQIVKA